MSSVIIYSKANCPYCDRAKLLLEQEDIAYEERRVDQKQSYLQEMIDKGATRRSFPQIFINDEAIGGFDDLLGLWKSDKLRARLSKDQ